MSDRRRLADSTSAACAASLVMLAFVAIAVLSACGSDDTPATRSPIATSSASSASSPMATRTPAGAGLRTPTAVPPTAPAANTVIPLKPDTTLPVRPPDARAIAGASSVTMTRGSFVWDGVQADAVRVVTTTDRLTAAPGATIVVPNPAPLALTSADAGFVPATDQPVTTEAGRLEWPYGAFTRAGIAAVVGDEAHLTAPTQAGTYVGTVLLRFTDASGGGTSQAYYHFLLDVR